MADRSPSQMPTADSVRLALPAEAEQIAALQRRTWEVDLPTGLVEFMLHSPISDATEQWSTAITRPPLAQYRVLVAIDGATGRVVGFATTGPSPDPDAQAPDDGMIGEFAIDPAARGRGHGSRLLHAAVDTLVADKYQLAQTWVRADADGLRAFLTSAGWGADGAHRDIGTDSGARVRQVRLHTAIADPAHE